MFNEIHKKILFGAIFWWFLILISLPFGRYATNQLRERQLLNLSFVLAVLTLCGIAFALLFVARRSQRISQHKSRHILFLFLSFILLSLTLERPEERWHVFHYGVLGILFWESFRRTSSQRLMLATFSVVFCGFIEEFIQYFIPQRVFDWQDVLLNGGSGIWSIFVLSWREKKE